MSATTGLSALCLLLLGLQLVVLADNYVDMVLTSNTGGLSTVRFSEVLFIRLLDCLCQVDKICYAAFRYEPPLSSYYYYTVWWVYSGDQNHEPSQPSYCRYYICKIGDSDIQCQVKFSGSSLSSTSNLQYVSYPRNSSCSTVCATFSWSSPNEMITSNSPNLLATCGSYCQAPNTSSTTTPSTTLTTTPATNSATATIANTTSTLTTTSTTESATAIISTTTSTKSTKRPIITTESASNADGTSSKSLFPNSTLLSLATRALNISISTKPATDNSSTLIVAVVVPILIALAICVVTVVFLCRRRLISKQELLRQKGNASSVVLPPSGPEKEPVYTYIDLNSIDTVKGNKTSLENISSCAFINLDPNGRYLNTVPKSNNVIAHSNSSHDVYSNEHIIDSRSQSSKTPSSVMIGEDSTLKRIVYFSDSNSRDESDDAHLSVYSLASGDVSSDADAQDAVIKQLKSKQDADIKHRERELVSDKSEYMIEKQNNNSDYDCSYMDIDNINTRCDNLVSGTLPSEGISKGKKHHVMSDYTNDEIYLSDNVPTNSSSLSGTYNNIAIQSKKAAQGNPAVVHEEAEHEEESPTYYYSSNANVLQNLNKVDDEKEDGTEKSSRTSYSCIDKDNHQTSDGDSDKISHQNRLKVPTSRVYSNLRQIETKVVNPYNSLLLEHDK